MPTKEQLVKDFTKMDLNQDGVISLDEFKAILQKQQGDTPGMNDETANAILETLKQCGFDKNGDGQMQVEELAEAFAAQS